MLLRACMLLFLTCSTAHAAERFQSDPAHSTLTFTATQNNSPVKGSFTQFTTTLSFDAAAKEKSTLQAEVTLESVRTDYGSVADTLKNADWFDIARFPKAIFTSSSFTSLKDNAYEVQGTLSLRDRTQPVTLHLILSDAKGGTRTLTGKAHLKRTAFGVGQGDWAKTDTVADDVTVDFSLTLVPAP